MSTTDESVTDESTESTATTDADESTDASTEGAEDEAQVNPFKQKWENQRKVNRDLEAKLKKLNDDAELAGKPDAERAIAERIREATSEATSKANQRLIAAEVRAAAAGKVKNPALALKLIDTSGIDVDDDGEVDSDALNAAIAGLLTEYPELAADGARFGGGADQGAKGKAAKAAQLSEQDLNSMTPEQISEARASGRLDTILGVKH